MATFFVAFVLFTGLTLILASPLFVVARRKNRTEKLPRFLIGAVVVGALCAMLAAGSQRLVSQCEAAGNPACIDFGATGMQILFTGGFTVASWLAAYTLMQE